MVVSVDLAGWRGPDVDRHLSSGVVAGAVELCDEYLADLVSVDGEDGAKVSRFTVGLDMDGVCYDFVGAAAKWSGFKKEDATGFDIFGSWGAPGLWTAFDKHVQEKGFCLGLDLLPGAQWLVGAIQRVADVLIVTSPYRDAPYWAYEREQAIRRDFGIERDMVMSVRSKQYARVDVLIDDKPANIVSFPGNTILVDQPWNQSCAAGIRCKTHSDILEVIGNML